MRAPESSFVDGVRTAFASSPPPIVLGGRSLRAAKQFVDGTHRTRAPAETFEAIRPHFPAVGVTRIADITGLDRIGIPTTVAQRPNGRTMSNAAGKGLSLAAASVSAAMEAIEMFHAEHVALPVIRASHAEIARRDPAGTRTGFSRIRRALVSHDREELWLAGWDLLGQREAWLPYSTVALAAHGSHGRLLSPYAAGTNGLASGNHLLEAICAGLLEVIERDAVSCHAVARARGAHEYARVHLDTIDHPLVRGVLGQMERAGIAALLYDCTVDTAVPVHMAIIYDQVTRHVGMHRGYGAHLDPFVATLRALTEAVQSRLGYIAASRDDYFRHDHLVHHLADSAAAVAELERIAPTVDARDWRPATAATFEEDVARLLERLRRVGIERVLVADLTREDIGIPVVRVVVPGLEGYMLQDYTPGPRARAFAAARGAAEERLVS